MLGKGLCVLLKVLLLARSALALLPEGLEDQSMIIGSLEDDCATRCPDLDLSQNRTDDGSTEVGCGVRCKIDQCTKGCAAWEQALETSCQSICNGTQELLPPKELYCVLGCHDALNRYFQQLKAEIGVPPAPALVADSLTATSLRLEWKGVDIKRRAIGISYLVQWRYEELAETWQYCRNQSLGEDDQILVENLQPYTKYRFRVALLLKSSQHNPEPIVSAPSVVIMTLAAGRPTSAPVIVRAAAVDSNRVSVSWEPGPFPNGPLLSYVLQLQGANNDSLNKDIPAPDNTYHYMFPNLKPNQNYSVSVSMRNADGDGPRAVTYITTPPEPVAKDTQQPILILGGERVVLKQGADMLDDPSVIYRTTSKIRGVAIHVAAAQLFISDSMGYIYRTSILETTEPKVILRPDQSNFKPLSLSVDWLNSHLYIVGEVNHATTVWQIARCTLDGKGLTIAKAGFMTEPSHIEVDPYNGYLFWVTRGGLFRLDLADISNGIKHEVQPYLMLEDKHLAAFTVDHTNFRLLVPNHMNNTVISVSLDGKEISNLRSNTQQPKFRNVLSLAMANGLFYWTNGKEVLTEGYHAGQKLYFHNAYPDRSDGSFVSVNVLMDASQPIPVPVNPPTGVQAVLGADRAKVSWQAPHLLGGQGKGAWQNWSYELEIKDESTGHTIKQRHIAGSSHIVKNLREKSEYIIKAAAYTEAGKGPWSSEFHGKTLRENSHSSILWSADEGLLKSDVTGENVQTLIHRESLKDFDSEYHIVDVSWYKDILYIVGNNSALYKYNITSHQKTKFNINSVGSVAVDWIAKKLYWANPKQQIITRANLNGTHQEPMSILAIVKELIIDSQEAYLYWSTGHAVEVARLNGLDRRYYHSDEIFNGKQVMGLTLNTEDRYVYWIVRSYESGSIVYRAPTSERIPMSQKIVPEKVSTLQHPNMQGPLCYFSEHLLWLQDDRNAVIGDLTGQNTAVINGISLIGLHMVAVMDPALHQYPENLTSETISVIPNAVSLDSIRVEGTWRNFSVSWAPVININYGTVFYEVKFADYINTNSNAEITTDTSLPYNNSDQILPYSVLEVTVKAFTYWGTAPHSRKMLRSPQSVPSQPSNVRAFVEHYKAPTAKDIDIFMTFRWNPPEFPNGLIKGYFLKCWFMDNGVEIHVCQDVRVGHNTREYIAHNLEPNTTYHFQVQASTDIGPGPFSDVIEISTKVEHPVPQLLVATTDSVKLADLDLGTNETLTRHIAVEVRYITAENKLYWINEMQEIVTADPKGRNATKILSLNGTASSLAVDWVARNLYWAEEPHRKIGGSRIMKLDLSAWEGGSIIFENIITSENRIINLELSPLTGDLFWIEVTKVELGTIMQSNLAGGDVRPFSNHNKDCTCPYTLSTKNVMTVDSTDPQNPVMYWVTISAGELTIATIDGCYCDVVAKPGFNRGLPPSSLSADKINVYWSNGDHNEIHFVKKNNPYEEDEEQRVERVYLANIKGLKAIGKSLQPYPALNCLTPSPMSYAVTEVSKKANSITIKLPKPESDLGCNRYNLPGVQYKIYVSQCTEDTVNNQMICDNEQTKSQTYQSEIEVPNLKPFTFYKFTLGLSNYYRDLEAASLQQGSPVMLRTAPGIPSAPENVTVEALTPTLAAVYWLPPKIFNAAAVHYEIHWSSLKPVDGKRQKGEQLIKNAELSAGRYSMMLQPLKPGQDYQVYVRAYPADSADAWSESEGQNVRMYPEPNNITLMGASINALNLSWMPSLNLTTKYILQFTTVGLEKWQIANDMKMEKNRTIYHIKGLLSKTSYKFRLILRYPKYNEDFIWPTDDRYIFPTLGDVPGAPGAPKVTKHRNSVYQVNWEAAEAHGSDVRIYRLEGKIVGDLGKDHDKQKWITYYNGTHNYWIIAREMNHKYQFRVQAQNDYGFGEWSKPSDIIDLTDTIGTTVAGQQHLGLVLGLSVPVVTIVLLCFCYFLCLYNKQRKEVKKAILPPIVSDVELATLREIPRSNFVQSNALYASSMQNDHDDLSLPKIRRDQIVRIDFLGRGAFGEVHKGEAKGLDGPGMTPVAIKTLRKGASAQEKTEFIQEARLMSHFRHKHVLRLLGVCQDIDGPQLVLELMEAGDLLTYLRTSRYYVPTDPQALRLQDLLAMCEDVARGCRYLEELHFVHRDLACRNCLVSAKDRENRVVKIGDFGLARDIYKNDYYRKEGEGLLPVRWMAPESLMDGVFTTQSDVWAFGILMWEITSLGQQPYAARSNVEVLQYVRNGGRLTQPDNCPDQLYDLMQRCWSAAENRPSFKTCLERIIMLKKNTPDSILTPVQAGHYPTRRGVSNMAYFADENQNHNNSGNSWKSSSSEGSRDMKPFLQDSTTTTVTQLSTEVDVPKYLEIIADSPGTIRETAIDEYEVPRSIPISNLATISPDDRKHLDTILSKLGSLNSVAEKSQTLSSSRLVISALQNDLRATLNERAKLKRKTDEATEMSTDERNCNSLSSSISSLRGPLPSTRPSSSVLESQQNIILKKDLSYVRDNNINEPIITGNSTLRLHKTHTLNSKANIPLVINNSLLNLLRQTSGIDDSGLNIVTYTNVNTDSTRVN